MIMPYDVDNRPPSKIKSTKVSMSKRNKNYRSTKCISFWRLQLFSMEKLFLFLREKEKQQKKKTKELFSN